MEYLSPNERIAISNLYGVTRKLLSDYPSELALVYKEILGEEINPSELNVSENAALLFECLYLEEGSYSETFNILNVSIADNSANDASPQLYGCVDPEAQNFNPEATIDDGSCMHGGSRAMRSCNCATISCFVTSTTDPCYAPCCDTDLPSPNPGDYPDNSFCGDYNATNYYETGPCEYEETSGGGLLNSLTTIGNALWGIVEAIGIDTIYNDIMGNDEDTISNNQSSGQSCEDGKVYCYKNGIAGCYYDIECDAKEKERSYTWLYVTLGVLVVGGIGYYLYKKNK